MEWKELINGNFSRKAEIVIITIIGLSYVTTLKVDPAIVTRAIYCIAGIGALGILAQAIIDLVHPKTEADADPPITI